MVAAKGGFHVFPEDAADELAGVTEELLPVAVEAGVDVVGPYIASGERIEVRRVEGIEPGARGTGSRSATGSQEEGEDE